MAKVTVVIPALNEARAVGETVRATIAAFDATEHEVEVIVVDDGSRDATAVTAERAGARVLRHPINLGYGNALLHGILQASHPIVAITDADGTYPVQELPSMVSEFTARRLDMFIGARTGCHYRGTFSKSFARRCFKWLAEFTCGRTIPDINSGFRVIRRSLIKEFAGSLCGGFSFTTTLTIISCLTHRFVDYRPIAYSQRVGESHVRYFRDTLRTLQIMSTTMVRFNPIKFFLLLAVGLSILGFGIAAAAVLIPEKAPALFIASLYMIAATMLSGFGFLSAARPLASSSISSSILNESNEPKTSLFDAENSPAVPVAVV